MRSVIWFLVGASVGALGGFITARIVLSNKYEQKANKEISEAIRGLHEADMKAKAAETKKSSLDDDEVIKEAEDLVEKINRLKEKAEKNHTVDYTAYSDGGVETPDDMIVKPQKTIKDEELDDWGRQEEENIMQGMLDTEERERHRHDRPKIIKKEQYGVYGTLTTAELLYYQEDDSLVWAETNEEIVDLNLTVGDCLDKYGFRKNTEKTLYVRNMFLGYDFMIHKRFDSFVPIGNETG